MVKSEQTRSLLVETALRLFRERGYDASTMRLIAAEAGVSVGNAYYYFDGKDALVQELYRRIQADHRTSVLPHLRPGLPLADALRLTWEAGVEVMRPYHGFGTTLLSKALAPGSPVSPFSADSAAPRAEATDLMREVLAITGTPAGVLGEALPRLLWLAYLGVTLHWVTDGTPGQERTGVLIDGLAPIVARTMGLARLPVGRRLAGDAAALLARLGA